MVIFYQKWKKYNEIQLTKNKMDLNIRKMTNHPPSPEHSRKNNTWNEDAYAKGSTLEDNKNSQVTDKMVTKQGCVLIIYASNVTMSHVTQIEIF